MDQNFISLYRKNFTDNWDLPAFTDYQGRTLTYGEAAALIMNLHGVFRALGLSGGDKVALTGKNSSNWAVVYLAVISYGGVIVPVLPDFTRENAAWITDHSDALVLFISEGLYDRDAYGGLKNLRAVFSLEQLELVEDRTGRLPDQFHRAGQAPPVDREELQFRDTDNSEIAVISYTSGTTGNSKGVMLAHASLMANVVFAQNHIPLKPMDKIVSFLPLAHAYGCAFEFLYPVSLGCHITFLTKTPSPQIITRAFGEIRPTLILSVPLIIEKIYKKSIRPVLNKPLLKFLIRVPGLNAVIYRKVRKQVMEVFGGNFIELVVGGAALSHEVEAFFRKIRIPLTVGYGMTECGPLISYEGWRNTKPGSAGRLVDTLELKIDSKDPYKVPGEIRVRGINVMQGYYKNEEATGKVIDEDGWLHTGDLGVTDADRFIFIRGRNKSMILGPSGQNIYPEEIEEVFNGMEYVLESLVVEKNGRLIAILVPDMEAVKKDALKEEGLGAVIEGYRKEANARMPSYMQVAEVRLHREEFEKTPKKSIRRFLYADPDKQ